MIWYYTYMNTIPFTSVRHNFANGISLGENFLDEETWNSLSLWAQEAMLQLSETSIDYMDSAIEMAVSDNPEFPSEWKQVAIEVHIQQIQEFEKNEKEETPPVIIF